MTQRPKCLLLAAFVTVLLVGCAADRNNLSALYIASTFDSLLTKQVAYNLIETYGNKYRVPAYVKISSQTVRTADSMTPNLTLPILPQKTVTQSSSLTRAIQNAGTGIGIQMQTTMEANYTINAVDDPDELRRLRLIFQYAAGHLNDFEFEANYPVIVSGDSAVYEQLDKKGRVYVRRVCTLLDSNKTFCLRYDFIAVKPDLTFIRPPGCIMCDYNIPLKQYRTGAPSNAFVLRKNIKLFGRVCPNNSDIDCDNGHEDLIFYPPGEDNSNSIPVKTISGDVLYLKGERGIEGFNELTLFAQEASSQGAAGIGSGGQSFGRKTSPLIKISGPAAGGFITQ